MSFIEVNLGEDVKERECAPDGDYELTITDVSIKDKEYDDGNGGTIQGQYIQLRAEIDEDDSNYMGIFHILSLPNSADDTDKVYNKSIAIKRFCALCDLSVEDGGFNTEDFAGARFSAKVTVEVDEDGVYPPKNRIIVPRME